MARPCEDCGQYVERLQNGKAYNDDGSWHENTCRPSVKAQKKLKLQKAEWEAKYAIKAENKKEIRSQTPLANRGRC